MRLSGSLQAIVGEAVAWMRQVGRKVALVAGVFVLAAIGIALLLIFGVVALWIVVIYAALALAVVAWRRIRNRFAPGRQPPPNPPGADVSGQRHDTGNVKTIDVVAEVEYVDDARRQS